MKRLIRAVLFMILPCALLLGAAAPVQPSTGLYVTDYAGVVFREHRDFILEASLRTKLESGVDVAVLTVKDLQGMSMPDYAAKTAAGWGLGGESGDFVLLLYCAPLNQAHLLAGPALWGYSPAAGGATDPSMESPFSPEQSPGFVTEEIDAYLQERKYSRAVYECYKSIIREVYRQKGVIPDERFLNSLSPESSPRELFWTSVAFVGAMLIMLRSLFVSRRYRQRYGKGRRYARKRFTSSIQDIEFDLIREEASDSEQTAQSSDDL